MSLRAQALSYTLEVSFYCENLTDRDQRLGEIRQAVGVEEETVEGGSGSVLAIFPAPSDEEAAAMFKRLYSMAVHPEGQIGMKIVAYPADTFG